MKLYIDDIREAPDESWTVVRNISEAINAIAMFGERITNISIDHDISYEVIVDGFYRPFPSKETFRAVARYMGEYYKSHNVSDGNIHLPYPIVTIHSSNPDGAGEIQAILEFDGIKSEYIPCPPVKRKHE